MSGGRDSVALLDWLIVAGYKNLTVCHLNHQLRARASEADARFVEKLATRYDLPIASGAANVRALAEKKKLSIEAAGREARYKFFSGVAKRTRCRTIFLGHHADDVVETFLINLFRGSGTAGLAGMREVSRRRVNKIDLTVVRPFVATWRNEIDRYVRARRLKFREDKSNRDPEPLRNRIRLRIIPYLEKSLGRKIRQSIWRAAMIAAEEEAWMEKQVAKFHRKRSCGLQLARFADCASTTPDPQMVAIARYRKCRVRCRGECAHPARSASRASRKSICRKIATSGGGQKRSLSQASPGLARDLICEWIRLRTGLIRPR